MDMFAHTDAAYLIADSILGELTFVRQALEAAGCERIYISGDEAEALALNELPRSKLRGIKPNTRNPNNLEQRQLDILTMQLLVNLFGSLIFDVAANRFFTPVAAHGAHEVAFGPKFATP